MSSEKPFDVLVKKIHKEILEANKTLEGAKPYLDTAAKKIQKVDNKIEWFEKQIKELEKEKQEKLGEFQELLDAAGTFGHTLYNGYTIRPDNRYKAEILDKQAFFAWLKKNRTPDEVLDFLGRAISATKLKNFVGAECDRQKERGIMEPQVDGVKIFDINYRRLTTEVKKVKKK